VRVRASLVAGRWSLVAGRCIEWWVGSLLECIGVYDNAFRSGSVLFDVCGVRSWCAFECVVMLCVCVECVVMLCVFECVSVCLSVFVCVCVCLCRLFGLVV